MLVRDPAGVPNPIAVTVQGVFALPTPPVTRG
jgi:hypothetical protein